MKKHSETKRSLEEIISELPDDPSKVKAAKKLSVKDAIILLREPVGAKVFTKRDLKALIEAAFPVLAPVVIGNIEISLERAKEHVECVKTGPPKVYRFKLVE